MGKINWTEILQWGSDQIEEIQSAGFSYIKQGKYDMALPFYEALVVLDPEDAFNNQTLGALYLQTGEAGKAIRYLDKALQLDETHAPTLLNLTKVLLMTGRTQEALKLAKVLESNDDPDISNIAKALLLAYN